MAQHEDGTTRKKGKFGAVVVWALMAMLVVGLGGFGVTNFGGGLTSIGRVGDREIDVNTYSRALGQEMQAFSAQIGAQATIEQIQERGIDAQVRQRLIAAAALSNEATRIGLSVGDARVAQEILGMPAFTDPAGAFDRETYRQTLQRNNLNETRFEAQVRDDMARLVLQSAVVGGFAAPEPIVGTLYSWLAEQRGFSLLRLTESDLSAPLPELTPADLRAFYDANPAPFTAPEAKRITYAALLPEMVADTVQLDEVALRAAYDDRIAEFVQPERRLVERLVFPTDADAAAAKARLDAGETFEALVAGRGLALRDIDIGEQSREDLGAAGDAVFALTETGVVGPFTSDLGPALFRMNAILDAQEVTFDEAREALAAEQATDGARRAIADRVEDIDDLLAGGATLEDLGTEAGMQVGTLDFAPGIDAPIAGYEAFRAAAAALQDGDFPELIELEDGGMVALRLDAIIPPALRPFDDVADDVALAARADALATALRARAAEAKSAVEGGASLGAFGIVDVVQQMPRDGFLENVPQDLIGTVFGMTEGEVRVIDGAGVIGLVRLDRIVPATTDSADAIAIRAALSSQIGQSLSQDAAALFATALTREAGIAMDEQAINAVHAQMR